jgi:hypothetical protein
MRKSKTTWPKIAEKVWLGEVRQLAEVFGWRVYHPWLSIRSEHGFPDLTLAKASTGNEPGRLIFAELKSEKGKVTPKQQEWLDLLGAVGGNVEVYTWRPSDFDEAARILR